MNIRMYVSEELSLLLFADMLDDVFKNMRDAGLGCHVNRMFTGAFIYADDITLISPSRESINHMMKAWSIA